MKAPAGQQEKENQDRTRHSEVDSLKVVTHEILAAIPPLRTIAEQPCSSAFAMANQVITDVVKRGPAVPPPLREADGLFRDGDFVFLRTARQLLHHLPVTVAGDEVPTAIDAGGVVAQLGLGRTRPLKESRPIQRRQQSQTGTQLPMEIWLAACRWRSGGEHRIGREIPPLQIAFEPF